MFHVNHKALTAAQTWAAASQYYAADSNGDAELVVHVSYEHTIKRCDIVVDSLIKFFGSHAPRAEIHEQFLGGALKALVASSHMNVGYTISLAPELKSAVNKGDLREAIFKFTVDPSDASISFVRCATVAVICDSLRGDDCLYQRCLGFARCVGEMTWGMPEKIARPKLDNFRKEVYDALNAKIAIATGVVPLFPNPSLAELKQAYACVAVEAQAATTGTNPGRLENAVYYHCSDVNTTRGMQL